MGRDIIVLGILGQRGCFPLAVLNKRYSLITVDPQKGFCSRCVNDQ